VLKTGKLSLIIAGKIGGIIQTKMITFIISNNMHFIHPLLSSISKKYSIGTSSAVIQCIDVLKIFLFSILNIVAK
jgi:hypothetical protein